MLRIAIQRRAASAPSRMGRHGTSTACAGVRQLRALPVAVTDRRQRSGRPRRSAPAGRSPPGARHHGKRSRASPVHSADDAAVRVDTNGRRPN